MILPLMGLFMLGIPAAGFFVGIFLLFIKRLRYLAPFAFLMPLVGSYAGIAGFWGTAIGLEKLGLSEQTSAIGALFGLVIGGVIGGSIGFVLARIFYRAGP